MSSETEPQAGALVTATPFRRKQSLLEAAEDPALTINLVWVETCSDIFSADVECVTATTIVLYRKSGFFAGRGDLQR
jgi:hypothetical protein